MVDYAECPFCGRIFPAETFHGMMHLHPLDDHIRSEHDKVKLRKGTNYRWVDRVEIERRIAAETRAAKRTTHRA